MCIFCEIVAGTKPAHFVYEDDLVVSFLDLRPLFEGHCLVVPRAHHETLVDLPQDLLEPVFGVARKLAGAVLTALEAEGTFVALNNRISQSVPHLHVHVVPRRKKDGLRGFFWPRTRYEDDRAAAEVATRIRTALSGADD